MAKVRALKDVYLGNQGHHAKGEEFDYEGPKNKNLEYLEPGDEEGEEELDAGYESMTRDELKAELERRGIDFNANSKDSTFRKLLEEDDAAGAEDEDEDEGEGE